MTSIETCFLCNQYVLGLMGQDNMLDPYYLEPRDKALKDQVYGPCHTLCLVTSSWGKVWYNYLLTHAVKVGGRNIVDKTNNISALRNDNMKQTTLLRTDGLVSIIKDDEINKIKYLDSGGFIEVKGHIDISLKSNIALVKLVQDALIRDGRFSLIRLIDMLGVKDKLIFPEAVERGIIQIVKKEQKLWSNEHISGKVIYAKFIPEDMLMLARSVIETANVQRK